MSDEAADALHVGVGVAATCIGVMCSLYHCCCRVWRRLKSHTPVAAAGVAVAAGTLVTSQLTGISTVGPPPSRGNQAPCSVTPVVDTSHSPSCGDQACINSTLYAVIFSLFKLFIVCIVFFFCIVEVL
jgi:hypothetical protein